MKREKKVAMSARGFPCSRETSYHVQPRAYRLAAKDAVFLFSRSTQLLYISLSFSYSLSISFSLIDRGSRSPRARKCFSLLDFFDVTVALGWDPQFLDLQIEGSKEKKKSSERTSERVISDYLRCVALRGRDNTEATR